jgi:hypothetical protein
MLWIFDDGGRKAAGFRRRYGIGDCVPRSIAIAAQLPYRQVHEEIEQLAMMEERRGRRCPPDRGVNAFVAKRYLEILGWRFHLTNRAVLSEVHIPKGRLVAAIPRHFCAVIDHVVHDVDEPSARPARVRGYFAPIPLHP